MRKAYEKYLRIDKMPHIWCPGCGHGIILNALVRAFDRLALDPSRLVVVSGIGCSSRTPGYIDACTLHTTHGRALAFATGIKLAAPHLKVVAVMGDGDSTAIGGNHFIHAARRNIGITVIVCNNNIYGMTGGQYSPTTPTGSRATTAPYGFMEKPFDIAELAVSAGAMYVGRSTTFHVAQMERLMEEALKVDGFSMVEVMTYCHTTWGRMNKRRTPWENLLWQKTHAVDVKKAESMSQEELRDKIIIGLLHKEEYLGEYCNLYASRVIEASRKEKPRPHELEGDAGGGEIPDWHGRREIMLSGAGGQGLLLAGVILAESACIYWDRHAVQSQSYGPEARGGASRSEVVLSETEVYYPKVRRADVMLALTQQSWDLYHSKLRDGAVALLDESVDVPAETLHEFDSRGIAVVRLPIVKTARDKVGREVTTNMVALGALNRLARLVPDSSLRKAVYHRVPRGSEELNLKALEEGAALVASAE